MKTKELIALLQKVLHVYGDVEVTSGTESVVHAGMQLVDDLGRPRVVCQIITAPVMAGEKISMSGRRGGKSCKHALEAILLYHQDRMTIYECAKILATKSDTLLGALVIPEALRVLIRQEKAKQAQMKTLQEALDLEKKDQDAFEKSDWRQL